MNQSLENPLLRFRLSTLVLIMFVGAIFLLMAQKFGVNTIKPWAFFALFCTAMYLIGRWLVKGIDIARENDPSTPSQVASFENSYEANLLVSKLEDFGIHATTAGTFTSGFQAESPGLASVYVAKEDLIEAKRVMAELETGSASTSQ